MQSAMRTSLKSHNTTRAAERELNGLLSNDSVLYIENTDGTKIRLKPGCRIVVSNRKQNSQYGRGMIDYTDLLMEQQEQM